MSTNQLTGISRPPNPFRKVDTATITQQRKPSSSLQQHFRPQLPTESSFLPPSNTNWLPSRNPTSDMNMRAAAAPTPITKYNMKTKALIYNSTFLFLSAYIRHHCQFHRFNQAIIIRILPLFLNIIFQHQLCPMNNLFMVCFESY